MVADFNGDAKPDVATTSALLLGDGAGGFSLGDPPPVGAEPRGLATADFNGDGKADLVVANDEWCGDQDTRILLCDGAGHFTDAGAYPSFLEPGAVMAGDLNGDGKQDVVTAESLEGDQVLEVLLGDGLGGFTEGRGARLGCNDVYVSVLGDFDGDGRLDAAGTGGRAVVVLLGDGRGGFLKQERFPARRYPTRPVAADFNRDGLLDVAALDYLHDALDVLLSGPRVAPVLESLSPRRGHAGAVVTLVGAHFGTRRGAGVVKFGAAIATEYVSWSGAKIRVRVPDGTLSGWVRVRVQTVAGRSVAEMFLRS